MATSKRRFVDRAELAARAPLIGAGILLLTLMAVGIASVVLDATGGLGLRLPIYALTGAVTFVGALLVMRQSPQDATVVLGRATTAGVLGTAAVGLGTEGIIYTFIVLVPGVSLYLLAAGIVACGLVYWSLRNWDTASDLTRTW